VSLKRIKAIRQESDALAERLERGERVPRAERERADRRNLSARAEVRAVLERR
jgi:hypothetical protein